MKSFKQWLEATIKMGPQGFEGIPTQPKIETVFKGGSAEQVAPQFYAWMQSKYPGRELGSTGSGNCSWTAKAFQDWTGGQSKLIHFLYNGTSAHAVPVYQGKIIDYIQTFTRHKPWLIHPVGDQTKNKVIPLIAGGLGFYKEWYYYYILGNTFADIDRTIESAEDRFFEPWNKYKASTGPFEEPSIRG
jgi:hypothetical protein